MKRTLANFLTAAITVAILVALNAGMNYVEANSRFHAGYAIRVLMLALINVIAAVSLNLVNGFTGQFSLGHAVFFGIGAYAGAAFTVFAQKPLFGHILSSSDVVSWSHGGIVLLAAMLVGGLAAALAGFIVGLPSLKLRGDYLAIVTLGFNFIVVVVINSLDVIGGAAGFTGTSRGDTPVNIPALTSFFWVALVAITVIVLSINLRRSVHGLAFESIREDEIAAEAMGIPTTRYKVTAFVLAAFLAGVAGAMYVHYNGSVATPSLDFTASVNIVVMVVLGGLGSVSGSVVGAIILTVLPEALRNISPDADKYRLVVYSVLLIILMLLRPQGIFGRDEIGAVWFRKQINGTVTLPRRSLTWLTNVLQRRQRRGGSA
ncbi:MAG TPA: branched-chain amino acid ABC transporter permease [Capsulimonadaceae bacterium]